MRIRIPVHPGDSSDSLECDAAAKHCHSYLRPPSLPVANRIPPSCCGTPGSTVSPSILLDAQHCHRCSVRAAMKMSCVSRIFVTIVLLSDVRNYVFFLSTPLEFVRTCSDMMTDGSITKTGWMWSQV